MKNARETRAFFWSSRRSSRRTCPDGRDAAIMNSIGIDSMVLVREARNATRRAFAFSSIGRRHHAQYLLLVRPDQYPDVEQHDGAEPGTDADRVERLVQEQERVDEIRSEQHRAEQPGRPPPPSGTRTVRAARRAW